MEEKKRTKNNIDKKRNMLCYFSIMFHLSHASYFIQLFVWPKQKKNGGIKRKDKMRKQKRKDKKKGEKKRRKEKQENGGVLSLVFCFI